MAKWGILAGLPNGFADWRGDFLGGTLAAVVALPLALAFGVASGLGAQAGLYGAIACGIFAGMFGGTPGQVSGPTGPMTVVAAGIIAAHSGHPELVFAAVILGGLLQVAMGLMKAGELIHYIPYPVISGFMSGIGLIIILVEIPPLFGLPTPSNAIGGLQAMAQISKGINFSAFGVGLFTITIIYLLPKVTRQIPAALVALLVCTTLVLGLGLDIPQIRDVGVIPQGVPRPVLPNVALSDILTLVLPAAVSLALLGSIDSLLTSVVVDKITFRRHNSNKELVGQGIGNIASGLFGGLPGAGATMRSVVNVQNGGKTQLSAVFHGLLLLAVLLGLGGVASQIPLACLAGILITVGVGIIDYRGLKSVGKASIDDVLAMLTVLTLTVFLDLIMAVLIGLALAAFLFCKRLSDLAMSEHGHLDAISHLFETIQHIPAEQLKGMYVYTFNGPLFFGEVRNFNQVMAHLPQVQTLILHFQNVPLIDQTGAYALEDIFRQFETRSIRIVCVGLSSKLLKSLTRLGIFRQIPENCCYETIEDALEGLAQQTP